MKTMGWYVETWGGERYTSIGYYARREDAEAECQRICRVGAWRGMPPRVTKARSTEVAS